MATYRLKEIATGDSTGGQDCGEHAIAELPDRLRAAIEAAPLAGRWSLPALSEGDSGEELDDLAVLVVEISR